jgi:hypothetical protein
MRLTTGGTFSVISSGMVVCQQYCVARGFRFVYNFEVKNTFQLGISQKRTVGCVEDCPNLENFPSEENRMKSIFLFCSFSIFGCDRSVALLESRKSGFILGAKRKNNEATKIHSTSPQARCTVRDVKHV